MQYISATDLHKLISSGEEIQIIDVRESHERQICSISGTVHIPMAEVLERKDEIRQDIPVCVHCRSGQRSAAVIHTLQTKFGYANLINLDGGVLAWADEVDSTFEKY